MQRPNSETVHLKDILRTEGLSPALIANLPGTAVFVVDRDLRYLLAAGEALVIAGCKPEDFVGRTIFEVLPPELAANCEPSYRKALAGEPFEDEHHAYGRAYISRGTPLRSETGEIDGVLVVSHDISDRKRVEDERKKAEAALRESEARVQSIANLVPDLLWDSEPDGSTHWYNQRWMEYTGQTIEQAIGWGWIDAIHPDDRPGSARRYWEAVEQGISLQQEHRIRRHDGIYHWFVVKTAPLKNESGKVIKMYSAATDIHDRKKAEAERLQLMREQSAREQERQRAETLAELDRAKTAFFSNVSHEFRTPLTLSLAPLQDALGDRTHPLDPVQRQRLELIYRNSLRLLKLVNTLLDFSRIEAGRGSALYEPTDLATYTTELASVFRSAIERAGLQLIVDCPPLPEPVFVDREMWEKIVLNLLSNAFKFTFEGKISVSLQSPDGNQAILRIQDTGTGIAPEHLPHLFERFYQVKSPQARTHDGSGIGLALVHELVQLQGGTIEINSSVAEGTCFTIALPFGTEHLPSDRQLTHTLASTAMGATVDGEAAKGWFPSQNYQNQTIKTTKEQTTQQKTPIADSSLPNQTPARVLVVDDNADMRDYLTRILSESVEVEAVADGRMALAAVQTRVPDLILSDVMMPGLDGFKLLEALRTNSQTKEVPIILLSARAGEEAIVEGLKAGADDYLIKPFSAQELISRVTAHLQMAQLRGEALRSSGMLHCKAN